MSNTAICSLHGRTDKNYLFYMEGAFHVIFEQNIEIFLSIQSKMHKRY